MTSPPETLFITVSIPMHPCLAVLQHCLRLGTWQRAGFKRTRRLPFVLQDWPCSATIFHRLAANALGRPMTSWIPMATAARPFAQLFRLHCKQWVASCFLMQAPTCCKCDDDRACSLKTMARRKAQGSRWHQEWSNCPSGTWAVMGKKLLAKGGMAD